MAWFDHDYLRVSNGVASEVLPWNSNGNNWRNTKYLLYRVNLTSYFYRWQIYDYEQGSVVSATSSFYGSNTPDPTTLTFNNSWVVSEASAGAQGDPHINPLFGNKYTI